MDTWHSILPNEPLVYHDQLGCTVGDNIQRKYLEAGTGGRRLCEQCRKIGVSTSARVSLSDDPFAGLASLETTAAERYGRRRLGAAQYYDVGGDPLGGMCGPDPLGDISLGRRLGE